MQVIDLQVVCDFWFLHSMSIFNVALQVSATYPWVGGFTWVVKVKSSIQFNQSIIRKKLIIVFNIHILWICFISNALFIICFSIAMNSINNVLQIPKLNISHKTTPKDHTSLLVVADFIESRHSGAVHFTGIRS